MTTTHPLTIEQLRVKLLAESVNAMQAIQWLPADEATQKHTEVYRRRLETTAGNLDQLISETDHESMSRSYRFLQKGVQHSVDKLMSAEETGDEEINRAATARASIFLLAEIAKMGY